MLAQQINCIILSALRRHTQYPQKQRLCCGAISVAKGHSRPKCTAAKMAAWSHRFCEETGQLLGEPSTASRASDKVGRRRRSGAHRLLRPRYRNDSHHSTRKKRASNPEATSFDRKSGCSPPRSAEKSLPQ